MPLSELKKLLEQQGTAFVDFRKHNDTRLAALEKDVQQLAVKAGRPHPAGGRDEAEQRERLSSFIRAGDVSGMVRERKASATVGSDPGGGYRA
ncbi:MAG: hypothetical protein AB9873_12195 [Syntrophobacteraceae bacterium]